MLLAGDMLLVGKAHFNFSELGAPSHQSRLSYAVFL